MPNIEDRLPQNTPGRFYVDSSCTDCDLCRGHAPEFFRRDDDLGYSIVFRQPVTDAEIQLCMEALEGCPTESIGYEPTQAFAAPESEKVMRETIVELLRVK